jgi:predicted ATPase/class 3 adenylate cyclase
MNDTLPDPSLRSGQAPPPIQDQNWGKEKILPTGTVTFLFTDIQGSTPLWEREPEKMAEALQMHNTTLRKAIEANGGVVFKTVGDAFQAAFATAPQALKASIQGQQALQEAVWNDLGPLQVRMGLHTGEAEMDPGGDEYAVSHAKNRAARIMSAAYGGQILLSAEVYELVNHQLSSNTTLKDLGDHHLKGMEWLEHLYQACAPGLRIDFPPLTTAVSYPNNLPIQMTSFIGREKEIAAVIDLLAQHRLVTLTGSGGVGKTRLSLAAAEKLLGDYPDGTWLVALAPVTDLQLVVLAVATALGLRSISSQPIGDILLDYLRTRQALLILDNCEHLIAACATLAHDLLQACQGLKILASSREALGVTGEVPFHVPSLSLPDLSQLPELGIIERVEGVRLFIERARTAREDFQLRDDNVASVVQVCQRLDGIPLAIELAVARLGVLTVSQLASRLDNAFRLLTGGARTALPRQQTLRATIDWSYQLLSEGEKKLLRRLAVFLGSFDLAAVEGVCCMDEAEQMEALDLLSSLENKSMLVIEHLPRLEMRYRLLETVRQYAREKLQDAGESLDLHDRHAAYFLDMAQEFEQRILGPQAAEWLRRTNVEFLNIRAALEWELNGPSPERGVGAVLAMFHYWTTGGVLSEGIQWLGRALSRVDPKHLSPEYAELLLQLGWIEDTQGFIEKGQNHVRLSQEIYKGLDDRFGYARATGYLACMTINQEMARAYFVQSTGILRELGAEKDLAYILWNWGIFEYALHDRLDVARSLLEESECFYRQMGCYFQAAVQCNLGDVYWRLGQLSRARNLYYQGIAVLRDVGDQWALSLAFYLFGAFEVAEAVDPGGLYQAEALLLESLEIIRRFGRIFESFVLTKLGGIAIRLQDYPLALERLRAALSSIDEPELALRLVRGDFRADWIGPCLLELAEVEANLDEVTLSARLLGALQTLRETGAYLWKDITPTDLERVVEEVRSRMDEVSFQVAWEEGSRMTLEQAVALALEG